MFNNTTGPFIENWLIWSVLTHPWLVIPYLSSTLTILMVLFTTMLKDPLNCFRSISWYLLFNLVLNGFSPLVTYCLCIATLAANTEYLGVYSLVFAFDHTILAVLLLSIDRYVLVSRPLAYAVIITKSRCLLAVLFSSIVCMFLTYCVGVRPKYIATKVFVFTLVLFIFILVLVIIVVDILTWRSIIQSPSRAAKIREREQIRQEQREFSSRTEKNSN